MSNYHFRTCEACGIDYNSDTFDESNPHRCDGGRLHRHALTQAQRIADLEAALAERTKERDRLQSKLDFEREEHRKQCEYSGELDATIRAIEAAIAEVYPAWLDAEDYADAIRRLGQERDALRVAFPSELADLLCSDEFTAALEESEAGHEPQG